jgi:hypothetical protein
MSEIKSLGLQRLIVSVAVGFSDVLSPSFTLLLVMIIVVFVVAIVHE